MKNISRREFLKYGTGGMAALVVGSYIPGILEKSAHAAFPLPGLDFTITDTIKEMVTHNAVNTAECYFWIYKEANVQADCPGPVIYATQGDIIPITVTNTLNEPHSFKIPLMIDTGPIAPNTTWVGEFTVKAPGTYLYYDNLNSPVNRVMGLHGVFISMPKKNSGAHWTPYAKWQVTPEVQLLFDELGTADHWPGLAWEEGNPATLTPPFRQCVWLCHQASPPLFAEVGDYSTLNPNQVFPRQEFTRRFKFDQFSRDSHEAPSSIPQYFTINGQSGHFGHNNPVVVPMGRVGEPFVVRVINAGLMSHSMHLHCNHFYVISVDRVIQGAPVGIGENNASLRKPGIIWIDTMTLNPLGTKCHQYDMVIPFMRPPDIPNVRGIGRGGCPDAALTSIANPDIPGSVPHPVYPPTEEFAMEFGKTIPVRQSPLCYPMHDHSEASQTAQGGNYNCGLIAGMYVIGDHNVALPTETNPFLGGDLPPQTFPMDEDFAMMIFRGNSGNPGDIAYGADEARTNGIMAASRDSQVETQFDRDPFP